LLAETTESGAPIREYIYAANQRIALVDYQQNTQCVVYFMVSDHLDTPQLLLDAQQQVVWSVDQSPFGEVKVEGSVEQPLRFPGQYADVETGYSYNYFRDYDPTLGRYIESDPIGLEAGVNTFGYVMGNPVMKVDPLGLMDLAGNGMMCYGNSIRGNSQQVIDAKGRAEFARQFGEADKYSLELEAGYNGYKFEFSLSMTEGYSEKYGFETNNGFVFSFGLDYRAAQWESTINPSSNYMMSLSADSGRFVNTSVDYFQGKGALVVSFRALPGKPKVGASFLLEN
jgi:RHS repeat-associated protein